MIARHKPYGRTELLPLQAQISGPWRCSASHACPLADDVVHHSNGRWTWKGSRLRHGNVIEASGEKVVFLEDPAEWPRFM